MRPARGTLRTPPGDRHVEIHLYSAAVAGNLCPLNATILRDAVEIALFEASPDVCRYWTGRQLQHRTAHQNIGARMAVGGLCLVSFSGDVGENLRAQAIIISCEGPKPFTDSTVQGGSDMGGPCIGPLGQRSIRVAPHKAVDIGRLETAMQRGRHIVQNVSADQAAECQPFYFG